MLLVRLEALKGQLEVQKEEKEEREERGMNDFVNVDHFFTLLLPTACAQMAISCIKVFFF